MDRRKRIDPRVIGSFVIGAIILSVSGLLFFGPGGFFTDTKNYVVYFDSSVKGLAIGSPVRFRGVKIGQIKEINVRVQPNEFQFHVPIVIEIEPSRFNVEGTDKSIIDVIKATIGSGDAIESLVDKGLRAQMRLDSLVTGQLYINLDMFPDTPIVLSGEENDYPELPSIKSSLEELSQTLEEIPLRDIAQQLINIVENLDELVSSPIILNTLTNFNKATNQLNLFVQNLDRQLPPVIESFKETSEKSKLMIQSAQSTIDQIDTKIEPMTDQFIQTAQSINDASVKTQVVMEQIRGLTANDSKILEQLSLTLKEINRTTRAVRYLTNEIERDPQILIRGRRKGEIE